MRRAANLCKHRHILSLISPFHTLFVSAERILPSSGLAGNWCSLAGSQVAPVGQRHHVRYIAVYALGFLALAVRKFKKIDIN